MYTALIGVSFALASRAAEPAVEPKSIESEPRNSSALSVNHASVCLAGGMELVKPL